MEETPSTLSPNINKSETKPKNNSKLITIICTVFAVAGIGFGIYEMTQVNSAKQQISDMETSNSTKTESEAELSELKQKYSVLQNYVKELEASGTEVAEEVKQATDTTADVGSAVAINPEEYIYVAAWGIKIHFPTNLKNISYIYDNYGNLCVNGIKYDGQQYAPEFAMIDKNKLACVSRTKSYGDTEVVVDGQSYYVSGSQAVYSRPEDTEEPEWEAATRKLFLTTLTDPASYSAI